MTTARLIHTATDDLYALWYVDHTLNGINYIAGTITEEPAGFAARTADGTPVGTFPTLAAATAATVS